MKNNKKGFTIVELVIVIAVIAILAAALIPTFSNVIGKANKSKVLQNAQHIYTQILADDLADGEQDAKVDGTSMTISNYQPENTTVAYNPATPATCFVSDAGGLGR